MHDLKEAREVLSIAKRPHMNVINFGEGETREHFLKKCELCYALKLQGKNFYTEAYFKDLKGRADVYCLEEMIAYEVQCSESDESIEARRKIYPVPIVAVKA